MSNLSAYKTRHWLAMLSIIFVAYFFLFYKLENQSVWLLGESLYVNSAHVMIVSGEMLVLTYLGEPDHYN
jgi:4-amino-4-deoxy-L-arabinose transferase-like glycosyltransferase